MFKPESPKGRAVDIRPSVRTWGDIKREQRQTESVRQRNYWDDAGIMDRMDDETDLFEYAERWLEEDAQSETEAIVFCGNCASGMTMETIVSGIYQMCCSHCGVSGPRSGDRYEAFTLTRDLFPE